jgi:hypothetical protein
MAAKNLARQSRNQKPEDTGQTNSERWLRCSAELHSISICENSRTLRKFPERGVYAAPAFLASSPFSSRLTDRIMAGQNHEMHSLQNMILSRHDSVSSRGLGPDTWKRAKAPRSFGCGASRATPYRGLAIRKPRQFKDASDWLALCRMQFGDTAECNSALRRRHAPVHGESRHDSRSRTGARNRRDGVWARRYAAPQLCDIERWKF